MKSLIASHLNSNFEAVALTRSNTRPEKCLQPKEGKYLCIMTMFAQVTAHGKTAAFDRTTFGCPGARAGLGMGTAYPEALGGVDHFAAFFSTGLEGAKDKKSYQETIDNAPAFMREKLTQGERFHCSFDKAKKWITEDLPLHDYPEQYRILKPLAETEDCEDILSVTFVVNPLHLATLITLSGSICEGLQSIMAPQGASCQMLGTYTMDQGETDIPRPVLGFTDLAARKHTRSTIPPEYLTFSVPYSLYLKLEKEAETGIFTSPLWLDLQD